MPLGLICGLYSVMLHRLWTTQRPGGHASSAEAVKNKKRVIKLCISGLLTNSILLLFAFVRNTQSRFAFIACDGILWLKTWLCPSLSVVMQGKIEVLLKASFQLKKLHKRLRLRQTEENSVSPRGVIQYLLIIFSKTYRIEFRQWPDLLHISRRHVCTMLATNSVWVFCAKNNTNLKPI